MKQDFDLFGDIVRPRADSVLGERFGIVPFTVLDARQGDWQERKRRWLSLGLKSEVGRGDNLLRFSDSVRLETGKSAADVPGVPAIPGGGSGRNSACLYKTADGYEAVNKNLGKTFGTEGNLSDSTGTSIFDPVVAELMYRWFSAPGDHVLDPFAGGSVRGIVASAMQRTYHGIELREEQVSANEAQRAVLLEDMKHQPEWWQADSESALPLFRPEFYDFILSCPPYGDLECYSDLPEDLSTLSWDGFREKYARIIRLSVSRLKRDRFAAFVVGNFRDRVGGGFYRDLVGETIRAFESSGAGFYNEAVLVTSVGSLPMRINAQWRKSRKLGRTHQNILVFCKGDPRKASRGDSSVDILS